MIVVFIIIIAIAVSIGIYYLYRDSDSDTISVTKFEPSSRSLTDYKNKTVLIDNVLNNILVPENVTLKDLTVGRSFNSLIGTVDFVSGDDSRTHAHSLLFYSEDGKSQVTLPNSNDIIILPSPRLFNSLKIEESDVTKNKNGTFTSKHGAARVILEEDEFIHKLFLVFRNSSLEEILGAWLGKKVAFVTRDLSKYKNFSVYAVATVFNIYKSGSNVVVQVEINPYQPASSIMSRTSLDKENKHILLQNNLGNNKGEVFFTKAYENNLGHPTEKPGSNVFRSSVLAHSVENNTLLDKGFIVSQSFPYAMTYRQPTDGNINYTVFGNNTTKRSIKIQIPGTFVNGYVLYIPGVPRKVLTFTTGDAFWNPNYTTSGDKNLFNVDYSRSYFYDKRNGNPNEGNSLCILFDEKGFELGSYKLNDNIDLVIIIPVIE